MYHLWVTVNLLTLTSDIVSRIIRFEANLLHYLRLESQIWCVDAPWDGGVSSTIFGGHCVLEIRIRNLVCGCVFGCQSAAYQFPVSVTLILYLVSSIIMSGAYLIYHLR